MKKRFQALEGGDLALIGGDASLTQCFQKRRPNRVNEKVFSLGGCEGPTGGDFQKRALGGAGLGRAGGVRFTSAL